MTSKTDSDIARHLGAMRKRVRHHCAACGKRFNAIKTAVYCSNACKQKAKYERSKTSRDEK